MSTAKSERKVNMDNMTKKQKHEKIVNDLLLQFAYTLTAFVLTIVMFNAIAQFRYGHSGYLAARGFMWVLFGVSIALGILFVSLYNTKKSKLGFKTTAIYSFVTAAFAFWFVGAEQIPFYLQKFIPFMGIFTGTYKVVFAMFPILSFAVIVEFVVYFIRYYSANK